MTETSNPVLALRADADADLSPLTEQLWREQTPHRVFSEGDEQLLYVLNAQTAVRVRALAAALAGAPQQTATAALPGPAGPAAQWLIPSVSSVLAWAKQAPVTSAVIVLALLCAPISLWGKPAGWLDALFFVSPTRFATAGDWMTAGQQLQQSLATGEFWRLVTPCLLHFSFLHLAMDVLLFWEFGQRIERVLASRATLLAVLGIGVVSNVGQFVMSGAAEFGGLSGIVTGQLGMILMLGRRSTAEALRLPSALSMGLLLSLVIMSTGVTELFGLYIANSAHWVGLVTGMALGWLWPMRSSPAPVR